MVHEPATKTTTFRCRFKVPLKDWFKKKVFSLGKTVNISSRFVHCR